MTPKEAEIVLQPVFHDRRSRDQFAPPYVTDDGVVMVDRRGSRNTYTIYDRYTYRAWVETDKNNKNACDAWYEILMADRKTTLCGPTKLSQQFVTADEAYVAIAQKVKWDIFHMVGAMAVATMQ